MWWFLSIIVSGDRTSDVLDAVDLEKKLRNAFARGFYKNGKHYSKILIVVEGIYSMEGTIINLPAILEVKKKYNAYLFLDEAHSIGSFKRWLRGSYSHFWASVRKGYARISFRRVKLQDHKGSMYRITRNYASFFASSTLLFFFLFFFKPKKHQF